MQRQPCRGRLTQLTLDGMLVRPCLVQIYPRYGMGVAAALHTKTKTRQHLGGKQKKNIVKTALPR